MKKLILIVLGLIIFTNIGLAQEMKYLFQGKDNDVSISGFAGVINEFSGFDGDFAFSMGGGAALLIDQKFFLGAYGQGVTTRHMRSFTRMESSYETGESFNVYYPDVYTRFGHGGFWLGYIHNPQKAINFGVNARLGWGAISMTDKTFKDYNESWNNLMYDAVFVITPELDVNLNLLKWMRVSFGLGYRVVTGVDKTYTYLPDNDPTQTPVEKEYFDKNAFNSVTGNITLAFGWFAN